MTLGGDLAIIGLACRFPGADDAEAFWANLCAGRESITWLTDDELAAAGVTDEMRSRPTYVKAAYTISDIDRFDARFFGISEDEARMMDPQQRILLELTYAALEHAGQVVTAQRRPTGVFATAGGVTTSYLYHHAARLARGPHGTGSLAQIGNDKDFLATRLAFKLNLTGIATSVQTACSSSLVALHLGRTALLVGDIDMAIVAASCIRVPQRVGYDSAENPILSPDGHCRAFADDAKGTTFGSGAAVLVLKRRADAVRDRDHVHALIKSTAATNDGGAKIGFTASSVPGQAKAMAHAITSAGVSATDLGYVECHGTGTRIGDPLELKALERVYRLETDATGICGIGSVKTNLGHLEQAAGLASLIKVTLMLKHRMLVPSLHCARGNTAFNFAQSPFTVVQSTAPWPSTDGRDRMAGVNSLGIGGTNGFAVLAEVPIEQREDRAGGLEVPGPHLVCLSAKSSDRLRAYAGRMAAFVDDQSDFRVDDFCYTVNLSRSHHRVRCAGVVRDRDDLVGLLRAASQSTSPEPPSAKPAVYVCNPSSSAAVETVDLFRAHPRCDAFRNRFDEVHAWWDHVDPTRPSAAGDVRRALAFELALLDQLAAWGVRFVNVTGVGLGAVVSQLVGKSVGDQGHADAIAAIDRAVALVADETAGDAGVPQGTASAVYRVLPASSVNGGDVNVAGHMTLERPGAPVSPIGLLGFLTEWLISGRELEWTGYYSTAPARIIPLPTYPFSRDRYWLDE